MQALSYEIKAYPNQKLQNDYFEPTYIGCGVGKRGKAKAIKLANEMWRTGKYEAVFVDAYNDEEIVDEECVDIPTV